MTNALRHALFAAIGGLVLTACNPQGTDPAARVRVDGAVAAVVNGDPVYLADVELEAAAQGRIDPGEPFGIGHPAYQDVLDQLIDQRLMAQEAVAKGLNREGTAPRRLEAARERVLGNILVESLVAAHVTDEKIRQMYSEQVTLQQIDDEVQVSMILVESEEEAAAVRERVTTGEEFSVVAFEVSQDTTTRLEGGALGYVRPALMGEPFSSAIGDTAVGDVSEPFQSEAGWHLIKVEDRRTPPPKTLEEMRPEIVTFLTYAEISQILKALRAEAVIEPGNGVPTVSQEPRSTSNPADDSL